MKEKSHPIKPKSSQLSLHSERQSVTELRVNCTIAGELGKLTPDTWSHSDLSEPATEGQNNIKKVEIIKVKILNIRTLLY